MKNAKLPTQAMPHDGRPGAPDGVNTQGDPEREKQRQKAANASAKTGKGTSAFGGFLGHGGQSVMGYHGPRQLGDREVEPGGNANAGAKTD